jgi:molybdenum cofactor cytidylyltransferase
VISAILPAAGESRRMRRPKLLLPFGDSTVAGTTIRSLLGGGVQRIVLVVAGSDRELRSWAESTGSLVVAENPRPQRGMLSTIVCGIEALGGAAAIAAAGEPLLVTPADMPGIDPMTVRRLLIAIGEATPPLAVPVHRGRRGHPLAIAARIVPEIASLDPSIGLRQLLERHPVTELTVDDPGAVTDLDTPAEYERLRAEADGSARSS